MDWFNEVEKRKDDLIKDTKKFLQIKSVLAEEEAKDGAPFGKGIREALDYALKTCESFGMNVKNFDGYAGHAEIGNGDDIVGILCHVDVVPEGDGWTSPPYSAEIRDGKIYARGAIDDKGPTMAAIYAAKIIKDLNLTLNKKVRIIFGTDEESGWRGIDYYFKKEQMPTIGFAPDADFPIITTEKGIATIELHKESNTTSNDKAKIVSFHSGERTNMVPDLAKVQINGEEEKLESIREEFNSFIKEYAQGGKVDLSDNKLTLILEGVSAHGMEPFKGINAGLELLHFLNNMDQFLDVKDWMNWTDEYLYQDFYGTNLGISFEDESGKLTVNPGILRYENNKFTVKLNIRYPVTLDHGKMVDSIRAMGESAELVTAVADNSAPHHVDHDHFLVRTLKRVYEEQTGEEATLLSIGGGTYARSLETGVAFGPLFPGKKETAHQKDEHIDIEDLLKATAIYVQAIYELAK